MKKNKIIRVVIIFFSVIIILLLAGICILKQIGSPYVKGAEGEKAYEFVEDMDADGEKESIKLVNQYSFHYIPNTCDAEYHSNKIKLYLDGKKVYSKTIYSLRPLLDPQIIEKADKDMVRKQIYLHDDGGGPAIPMDYFIYIDGDKVVLEESAAY